MLPFRIVVLTAVVHSESHNLKPGHSAASNRDLTKKNNFKSVKAKEGWDRGGVQGSNPNQAPLDCHLTMNMKML